MYCNSVLDIGASAAHDNSIMKKDFYTYTPYTSSLSESEEIRIVIQKHDSCFLPCESFLYMQVKVTTENHDDATPDANKIKLSHNFPSFLFSDARYELNGVEIDRIKNVGITSTMKLKAASSQSNTHSYYETNKLFTGKIIQSAKEIVYDLVVPLSAWFGFCDDFRKVILNSRHELILNRASNALNCIYDGIETPDTGKKLTSVNIVLNKLEWKMPYINLSDEMKLNMNRIVSSNKMLPIQFRSWDLYEYPELPQTTDHIWAVKTVSNLNKPRYVLVGFQNDKDQKKTKDVTKFNSVHMNSVRLHLNSNVYHMHDLDIANARLAELYESYIKIQLAYYNGEEPENQFGISFGNFQHDVLFAFDTSRSDESVQNGTIDIRLEMKGSQNIPAKTSAYCLIIYENEFEYSPADGLVTRSV